ncbi:DUF6339 family protein [Oribacterium sp. P6A1]|uniref:DUF6339 family protein n=1 Tax=Oribacterium sp. P6A1 TaxID=1410612 RepID=UPI000569D91C|nr:DUF6339 family protein [Oribacterium sp. P6A1]
MKIYFMKQSALDYIKTNIDKLYIYYFQKDDNSWMEDEIGEDPFVLFKEIPGLELASLSSGSSAGEIDLENCKRIYDAMKDVSESQASDERLWAGLCNGVFYKYMRRRYGYTNAILKDKEKDSSGILSRFFFSGGRRAGFYRNGLAKCWWIGRATYDKFNSTNHFEMLDILGPSDISTKISDIFYSNTFASNPTIIRGICNALKYYNDKNIKLLVREHIRPAIQYLNAVGGATVLDVLSSDEIKDIIIFKIDELLNGVNDGLEIELNDANPLESEDFSESQIDISEEILPAKDTENDSATNDIQNRETSIVNDVYVTRDEQVEPEKDLPEFVTTGCYFKVRNTRDGAEKVYQIPNGDYNARSLELIERKMLNKKVGHRIYLMGAWYELINISWSNQF